ncbi:3-isopropylmalate dehydrogenase [Sphingomonas sp. Root710]|uniref:3-isopropylmalate dehydrogenase n=1 Tax=Sphingomonas sp. Root710 TaxID=1736594 RepID=UPI000700AB66|nr:3-isopropylmalate dehydrogenase [Sphingomonas sp. Root710]
MAGDGVGPEAMAEVKRVIDWFVARRGLRLDLHEELYGISAWHAHGAVVRPEAWDLIDQADAILFGASGSPDYDAIPKHHWLPDNLLRMRSRLDLFDNRRPVRTFGGLEAMSSLRPEIIESADIVIVRELTAGLYFSEPRGIETLDDGRRRGTNSMTYTSDRVRRIAESAFELARRRSGRLCSVDKANVLEVSMLWREEVEKVHAQFPDVELSHMYVDNCAMQLVRNPRQFDVIVTENLFGDILSDCAAMVAGSIGMLPSASIGPKDITGRRQALYEPIHGSAPDIAGRGICNPIGSILSFGLCLTESFGLPDEADLLDRAVQRAIDGGARTADIAGGLPAIGTREMGDAVLRALDELHHETTPLTAAAS